MELEIKSLEEDYVVIGWQPVDNAESYRIYWADRDTPYMRYKLMADIGETEYTLYKATHIPHYLKVCAVVDGWEVQASQIGRAHV